MRRKQSTTTFKQKPRTPSVTFQPRAYAGFQRGVNLLANAIRPTLGPVPRAVAVEPVGPGDKRPELLDSGGVIVRRFLQVPDREADVGAMFLRHVLWRQQERVGDGTATTAALFQSIYNQGVVYVTAGGDAMRLRRHLERGMQLVINACEAQAQALATPAQYAELAQALCQDVPLAAMIAEIVDTVSAHGPVDVRSGRGRELERQYVLGTYYKGKPLSEWFLSAEPARRIEMQEAALLVSDLELNDPADLAPLLRLLDSAGIDNLLLLARQVSEPCISALLAAGRAPRPRRIVAVHAPDAVTGQAAFLDDLAILTGGRALVRAAGDTLRTVRIEDLGRARRIWVDAEYFGVIGGKGDARRLRAHVAALRGAFARAEEPQIRSKLSERIGKLLGGTAVLWVGGVSQVAIAERKELAKRTLDAVRATVGRGVLPGGGAALLACRGMLRDAADAAADLDERMAYTILARALAEPARAILQNAGYEPEPILHAIEAAGAGYGFDVRSGEVADMLAVGVIDAAATLCGAVHSAVASAALALTIDVMVHKRLPELCFEP
jgi:chaperonin GroEL